MSLICTYPMGRRISLIVVLRRSLCCKRQNGLNFAALQQKSCIAARSARFLQQIVGSYCPVPGLLLPRSSQHDGTLDPVIVQAIDLLARPWQKLALLLFKGKPLCYSQRWLYIMIRTLQLLTVGVIAFMGSGYAQDEMMEPAAASSDPVVRKECNFVTAKLVPEFSTTKKLEAGQKLDESAVLSEDDSVIVHLNVDCDVSQAVYASIVFLGSNPTLGKVVMMKAGKDSNSLKGKLKVAELKSVGPEVSVLFSVADPRSKPMQWDAGKITIMHRNGQSPIAVPPMSKHDAVFAIPPSLSHTFREPHEQPPAVVPLTATAFTVLPLLVLFYVLSVKLGANLSALSVGGASAAACSVAFLGCIGATLCLGVAFWVKLRLVDLFVPLGALALVTVLTGHQALSKMAEARMQKDRVRKIE